MAELRLKQLNKYTFPTVMDNFYGYIILFFIEENKKSFFMFMLSQYLKKVRSNIYIIDLLDETSDRYNICSSTVLFFKDSQVLNKMQIKEASEMLDICKAIDDFPNHYRIINDIPALEKPKQKPIPDWLYKKLHKKYNTVEH